MPNVAWMLNTVSFTLRGCPRNFEENPRWSSTAQYSSVQDLRGHFPLSPTMCFHLSCRLSAGERLGEGPGSCSMRLYADGTTARFSKIPSPRPSPSLVRYSRKSHPLWGRRSVKFRAEQDWAVPEPRVFLVPCQGLDFRCVPTHRNFKSNTASVRLDVLRGLWDSGEDCLLNCHQI